MTFALPPSSSRPRNCPAPVTACLDQGAAVARAARRAGRVAVVLVAMPEAMDDHVADVRRLLDAAERERAGRFRFIDDRRRFVIGRALLKSMIAGYCGARPEEVGFILSRFGRPILDRPAAPPSPLDFNLSHAPGLLAAAIGPVRHLGVDVEWHRRDLDVVGLARRHFTAREADSVVAARPERRAGVFHRLWVLKEAYLKARGDGLSGGLDRAAFRFTADAIDVRLPPAPAPGPVPVAPLHWLFAWRPVDDSHSVALAHAGDDPAPPYDILRLGREGFWAVDPGGLEGRIRALPPDF